MTNDEKIKVKSKKNSLFFLNCKIDLKFFLKQVTNKLKKNH